ncbi:uncharacterized protein [Palaemon carinicauda]
MPRWCLVFVFVCLLSCSHGGKDFPEQDEDEDLDFYLGKLFEENTEHLDVHDMLNYGGQKNQPSEDAKRPIMFKDDLEMLDKETCSFDKLKWNEEAQKLTNCQEQLKVLARNSDNDKLKLKNMEKKLLKEVSVDAMAFYRRVVYHLWNVLKLEEAEHILKDSDEAVMRFLSVRLTKDDIITLKSFLGDQNNIQQVDQLLQNALQLEEVSDDTRAFNIISIMEGALSVFEIGKNVEMWLYVLCSGFLVLAIWAIYLFIKDVQQELRWMRVIIMMIVLLFFICCMWHWRHMHKVAESRRHARMMKRGFTDIPEECKPGGQASTYSAWEWVKVRVLGSPDICEKYFEEMMIDPSEEITPAMVIAETLAKFILQPLQHLGSESAKFITNFYQNVPIVYHVPATVFFVVLLIIILFAFCGYGIDFPFWMGGIRPIYRTEVADTSDVDRITKEAIAQLKSDREKFMTESRMMLADIAQAASASQAQAGVQPLLMMSSGIIESQLERLIARQFSGVISQASPNGNPLNNGHSSQFSASSQNGDDVLTVTSTPLRNHDKLEMDVRDGRKEKVPASDIGEGAVLATPDAVHYRLKDGKRKAILPSKNSLSAASSEASVTEACESPKNKKTSKIQSTNIRTKSPGELEPTPHSPEVSLNNSLSDFSSDASFGASVGSDNFYDKVKTILEDSANSSLNVEHSNTSYENNPRDLSLSEGRSMRNEEVELSSSGVKFMSKIKKVMTP